MEAAGLIEKVDQPKVLRFNFEDVPKLPPPNIAFNEVAFSYSGLKKDYLYQDLSFGIDMDSRIAIVGDNGTGKSTLLNLITGQLSPCEGTVSKHPALKLAKYSQHSADQLPYDKSPIEHLEATYKSKFPEKDIQFWRQQIGRFGVTGPHQTGPISQLSDGLRNRVVFAMLALEHPHILLLDEPTNHLDMESIDSLAIAIKEFSGGVVIVSHDFRLISQVAEELWEVKDKKVINLTKEDITIVDYKKALAKRSKSVARIVGNIANPLLRSSTDRKGTSHVQVFHQGCRLRDISTVYIPCSNTTRQQYWQLYIDVSFLLGPVYARGRFISIISEDGRPRWLLLYPTLYKEVTG
jgi:ATP-binding cassette subfamily F protein 2